MNKRPGTLRVLGGMRYLAEAATYGSLVREW